MPGTRETRRRTMQQFAWKEWKLSKVKTWVQSLEQRPVASAHLWRRKGWAGNQNSLQSHVRFGWGSHSHVQQTIFGAYFGSENPNFSCRLHCNIGGNSTVLLQLNHHPQLIWSSRFSFAAEEYFCGFYLVSWAVLSMWKFLSVSQFPIHKSGSGSHWFIKVFWDLQEKCIK